MEHFSHLFLLIVAAIVFHAILWARNSTFLWANKRIILIVIAASLLWTLVTDPIGGMWGAWFFEPAKVIDVWFFSVTPIEDFLGNAVISSTAACAVLVFGYSPRRSI